MSRASWIVLAGTVGLAAAIGRWTAPATTTPAVPPALARTTPRDVPFRAPPLTPSSPPSGVVAAAPAAAAATSPAPAPPDAADHAVALIDGAIARGAWSADDWTQLDGLLIDVAPARRMDVLRELGTAINDGRVTATPPSQR